MNVGKLSERVSLLEPLWETNDYGRVESNGYVHHNRWAEWIPRHSKYFSIRFAGGQDAEGILRIRKDDTVKKCKKALVEETIYNIESRIEWGNLYYELILSEDQEDESYGSNI